MSYDIYKNFKHNADGVYVGKPQWADAEVALCRDGLFRVEDPENGDFYQVYPDKNLDCEIDWEKVDLLDKLFKTEQLILKKPSEDLLDWDLKICGMPQIIYITYDPEYAQLVVRALEENGEFSNALDNWSIYNEEGKLGCIVAGVLDTSFRGTRIQIGIADPKGNTYEVRLKK